MANRWRGNERGHESGRRASERERERSDVHVVRRGKERAGGGEGRGGEGWGSARGRDIYRGRLLARSVEKVLAYENIDYTFLRVHSLGSDGC